MATHPQTAPAPWGAYAPEYGILDTDTFLRLPDEEGWVLELYEGRIIRMPGPGLEHGYIQGSVIVALANYVQEHELGQLLGTCCYVLPLPDGTEAMLATDVSFITPQREATAQRRGPYDEYYALAPDLVVEIADPEQESYAQVQRKVGVFLQAGVRLVWVVWPNTQTVEIWRPAQPQQPSAVLQVTDTLDGQEVIPGFTCPVQALFQ